MMKKFLLRNKTIILYAFFGVLTTLINIAVYILCYNHLKIPNTISNIIAWILAVAFAFVTNKLYVFESKDKSRPTLIWEIISFSCARLTTGFLDLLIMFISVNILKKEAILFKIISNIVVIICNYVFSKLFVFRKKKTSNKENS